MDFTQCPYGIGGGFCTASDRCNRCRQDAKPRGFGSKLPADPFPDKHGTRMAYEERQCRCKVCVDYHGRRRNPLQSLGLRDRMWDTLNNIQLKSATINQLVEVV